MPLIRPDAMLTENEDAPGGTIRSQWISGPDGLERLGALLQTIPPGHPRHAITGMPMKTRCCCCWRVACCCTKAGW